MRCPIDRADLHKHHYEADVVVDVCPKCRGVWLDAGELERIQENLENDYSSELQRLPDFVSRAYEMARAKEAPARDCPSCNGTLDRSEYGYCSQILIDKCRRCRGIWLDRGELRALEVFFERCQSPTHEVRRGFFASLLDSLQD